MLNFFSRSFMPPTVPVPEFSGMEPVFEEKIVDGKDFLVKVGDNPLNVFVQASLNETLVYNILDRYNKGDLSVLERTNGHFVDVVGMPTSLAEAQQKLIDIEKHFSALPLAVRRKFDNSVNTFISSVADGSFEKVFSEFAVSNDVKKDVDTDVTE